MMALLGLHDDYTPDGVVLGDVIEPAALPPAMLSNYPTLRKLGQVYTQLEAAVGEFGLATLAASTRALASNSPGDATYTTIENQLTALGAARDALAAQMQALLTGAEFGGQPLSTSKSGQARPLAQALHAPRAKRAAGAQAGRAGRGARLRSAR